MQTELQKLRLGLYVGLPGIPTPMPIPPPYWAAAKLHSASVSPAKRVALRTLFNIRILPVLGNFRSDRLDYEKPGEQSSTQSK